MEGADCNIRDEKDNLPEDFIKDYDQNDGLIMELAQEVYDLVHEPEETCFSKYNPLKGCECFAIKSKFRRGGKSSKTLTCFFIIMITSFMFLNVCVFPFVFGLNQRKVDSNLDIKATAAA